MRSVSATSRELGESSRAKISEVRRSTDNTPSGMCCSRISRRVARCLSFPFQPAWHCSAPHGNFDLTGGDPRRTTALPITTAKYFPSKTPAYEFRRPASGSVFRCLRASRSVGGISKLEREPSTVVIGPRGDVVLVPAHRQTRSSAGRRSNSLPSVYSGQSKYKRPRHGLLCAIRVSFVSHSTQANT
jgi:hypothetical protein